ncbi:MAG: hypothetical protein BWK78_06355 [Thiotrichaceae bacterium IS1]|nr:MAG: hypothetical protein BWK78_06355 [Thiotrichaceae bacterium IS1]
MNWHIITSSKGGVGKTLVSLMLLNSSRTPYLKNGDNSFVLVLDLNGMNADLRRIVASRGSNKSSQFTSKDEDFHFEMVRDRHYLVGWPMNSFRILTPENFFNLISKINNQLKMEIQEKFSNCVIQTVIIDTSYHYCNLFPRELRSESSLSPVLELFATEKEQLFIWFIWVYRQLSNLFEFFDNIQSDSPYDADAREVQDVGVNIDGSSLGKNRSPFVHVFSPNSVGQVSDNIMLNLFGEGNPLRKLVGLDKMKHCYFADFISTHLRAAKGQAGPRLKEEKVQAHFIRILQQYVSIVKQRTGGCPRNVVPVLFESELLGYTESEKAELMDRVMGFEVYKSFEKSYQALIGVSNP